MPLYHTWQRQQEHKLLRKELEKEQALQAAQIQADKEAAITQIAADKALEVQRLKVKEAGLALERQMLVEQTARQLAADEAAIKEREEANRLALQERLKREERQRIEAQQEEEQRRIRNERSAKEAAANKAAAIEVKAQSRLTLGKKQIEEGNYAAGKYRLETLIRDYPDSEAAKEARKIVPSK